MSDTNRGRVAYIAESSFGVTPTDPNLQTLRLTSSDLTYNKETTQSNELDSSRMLTDVPEVGASSGGSLSVEWSPGSFDDLIEAALGGTRTSKLSIDSDGATTGVSVTTGAGSATLVDTATGGLFVAPDIEVGQWVFLGGYTNAGNNGWFRVTAITDANTLEVDDPAGNTADEATPPNGAKFVAQTIVNGVEERSFSIEQSFLDVFMYQLFRGQRISTLSMDLSVGSIATGSIGLMGTEMEVEAEADAVTEPSWVGSGTRVDAGTTKVLNSTSNVGDIIIDGAVSDACFQSLSLNIDNTLRSIQCIGDKFPSGISYGRQTVSGSISNMFKNWDLFQKMLDHEDIALSFGLTAPDGQGGIHIYLPRVTLSSDNVNLSGGVDSDVQESIDWSALKAIDSDNGDRAYQIRIDIAS